MLMELTIHNMFSFKDEKVEVKRQLEFNRQEYDAKRYKLNSELYILRALESRRR